MPRRQFGRTTTVPFSNWELANLTRCTLTIYSVLQTQKKIEFLLMMSLAIVCHMSPTIGIIYSEILTVRSLLFTRENDYSSTPFIMTIII